MLDGVGTTAVPGTLPADGDSIITLKIATPLRGAMPIGRLRIMSTWPFGLFRAWTWLHVTHDITV